MENSLFSLINKNLKFNTSSIDEDFICSKCSKLMEFPVEAPCSHVYCLECISCILNEENPSCIVDQKPLKDFKPFVSNSLKKRILKVKTKCPINKEKCDWLGSIEALEDHLKICNYFLLNCDCGKHIPRIKFEKHKKEKCDERLVLCKFCQLKLKQKELQEHFDVCPKVELGCPNNCTDDCYFTRDSIAEHLRTCPNSLVICHAHDLKMKRKEMDSHFNANIPEHFLLAYEKISEENKKLKEDFNTKLANIQAENQELKISLTQEKNEMKNIISKIVEIEKKEVEKEKMFFEKILELKSIIENIKLEKKEFPNEKKINLFWEFSEKSSIQVHTIAKSSESGGWVASNEIISGENEINIVFEILSSNENGWCIVAIADSSVLKFPKSGYEAGLENFPFFYNLWNGKVNGKIEFPIFKEKNTTTQIELKIKKETLKVAINGNLQNKEFIIPSKFRCLIDLYHPGTQITLKTK